MLKTMKLMQKRSQGTKNNKLILKSQQSFRSKKYNVFTKEVNQIALSANDDKRVQSVDTIETYAYGTSTN